MTTKEEHRNPTRTWLVSLALAAITLAVFSPLFHSGFLEFDDQIYVTENPYVRSGLNGNSLAWAFHTSTSGNWLPVTWISHMFDYECYGMKAGGHHLTNILLHAANAILLFLLLQRMTRAAWPSAFVAALFAWHPAHVESVAWIAERKDVLCAFFGLLSLWAYIRFAETKRAVFYLSTLVLFALGLMAKPMLVTWPLVLLLLDFWPLRRLSRADWPRRVLEKLPLLALSAAACGVAIWAQRQSHAIASGGGLGFGRRLEHALVSYLEYPGLLLCPRGLAIFYPYPTHEPMALVIGGAVTLIVLTALSIVTARRRPWAVVGWFWFVGMLVPVIGLLQVGDQALADRYTYLPSIGLFIIAAWGGAELAARWPFVKWFAPAAVAALLAATWTQVHYWKDMRSICEHALQVTDKNFMMLGLLGSVREADGDLDGAMKLYRESLRDKPDFFKGHFFLAHGLEQQGKDDEAKAEYELCLRLNPTYEPAHIRLGLLLARQKQFDQAAAEYEAVLQTNPRSATAHNDLARLLQTEGKLVESARHYEAALQFDSSLAPAHNNLGVLYLQEGKLPEAAAQLREALRLNPGNAETEYNLALALNDQGPSKEALEILQRLAPAQPNNAMMQYQLGLALARDGQTRPAMSQFARALLLTQDFPEALNALAWIAATDPHPEFRNGAQAVALASRACELTGRKQPAMLLTLAAAYAETGRFDDAAAAAQEGGALAKTQGNKTLEETAERINAAIAARKPFRETVTR